MIIKLLTEHHLEFLSLKEGCIIVSNITKECKSNIKIEAITTYLKRSAYCYSTRRLDKQRFM